jgi:hypothetical protein
MTHWPVIGLFVLLAFLAGCGGGGSNKEDFAKDADRICKQVEAALADISTNLAPTPQGFKKQVDRIVARSRTGLKQLKELDRPDGADGETATKFVTSLESEMEDVVFPAFENWTQGLLQKDDKLIRKGVFALQRVGEKPQASDRYARQLGANACGSA